MDPLKTESKNLKPLSDAQKVFVVEKHSLDIKKERMFLRFFVFSGNQKWFLHGITVL